MKYKLKELTFKNIKYNSCKTTLGRIINLEESIDFQTPTVRIIEIDSEYITLSLLPSEACKIFYDKIQEFEKSIKERFEDVNSLFENETFKVKIKNDSFKVYYQGNQFNIYHLKPGMDIICLVSISKLWENVYNLINYTLKVNEILVKKVI
jgi:hypothetical protein